MEVKEARQYVIDRLEYAFKPRSVAVIGASRNETKVGFKVIQGLRRSGYEGIIYPVNLKAETVAGLEAFKNINDIPDEVDLAFVALPAVAVFDALKDCVKKGVKIAVVSSSGFGEVGNKDLQTEIAMYCRENELPLIGPNLVGIGTPYHDFNCGFVPYLPNKGPVALISQSGSNLLAALGSSQLEHFGISMFVGLGNKADVDFCEMIKYADQEPHTKSIAVYIEALDSPEAFKKACLECEKPITVIKVGASKIGVKAAFAHTASENRGHSNEEYDKLFEESGVMRENTWMEFLDTSLALGNCPPLRGDNVVMITNGGGAGLLACDHFERLGYPLKELKDISPELRTNIRKYMPPFGSPLNPIDISGTATSDMYGGALRTAYRDENVDGIMISVCPTAVTDVEAITDTVIAIHKQYKNLGKPFIMECQGGHECREAIMKLRDHGIPAYSTMEQAVNAMVALRRYSRIMYHKEELLDQAAKEAENNK
ncbi:MAG: CoA-binding protein [Mogibacterium sp.]|nr:CoA-binding protein [Mogibacterium sp.]